MRTITALALFTVLSAGVCLAQETSADGETKATDPKTVKPDYSRDSLMRLLAEEPAHDPSNIRYHIGSVEFSALNTRWRFDYLPLSMPLSGTRMGVTQEWPDPFALSGTQLAWPPRTWGMRRAYEKELKRIGKSSSKIRIEGQ